MELSTRYTVVSALIDQANAADGVAVDYRGECYPKEVLYAQRHLAWVLRLQPDAGECLRIAAQTQHICRWEIPRADYPMNRSGYLKWREALKYFHAERAGLLMAEAGYADGFGLTVHAPNDRYVNDDKVAQTIAQMLSKIGLTMKVETMPKAVYFGRLNKQEFSL